MGDEEAFDDNDSASVHVHRFDWNSPDDDLFDVEFDLMFGSDLVYCDETSHILPVLLAHLFRRMSNTNAGREHAMFYYAHPFPRFETIDDADSEILSWVNQDFERIFGDFLLHCSESGLVVEELALDE